LRVYPSGRATWTLCYRPQHGGRRRLGLGTYPNIKLAEARHRAELLRGEISGGADPQAQRKAHRAAPTLGQLCEFYLEDIAARKKPATLELYSHYLRTLLPVSLQSKKAEMLTVADVAEVHRTIGRTRPVTANRVLVTISGVYTFGGRHGHTPDRLNPARGIEKFREENRERYLSNDELARLGNALRVGETDGLPWSDRERRKHGRKEADRKSQLSPHVVGAIRLLIFTGCRLREILHLRWSEVDLERGMLFLPDSKTGRKTVVLNANALQILQAVPRVGTGEFVILGDSLTKPRRDLKRPWEMVRRYAGLSDVRIHDLRHTHASVGAGAGLGLPIIGKLLGHKHHDTTQRYAHLDNDPLRRASERIGTELAAALGEESRPAATVIPIAARR
jgi:integrase